MLYKSGQLKSKEEVDKYRSDLFKRRCEAGAQYCGCIGTLPCKNCFSLISDSICLCAGYFICPECGFENGKINYYEPNNYDKTIDLSNLIIIDQFTTGLGI